VALTYHKGRRKAVCHTCDAEFEPAQVCPGCGRANLHYGGIGTERLERNVKSAFPDRLVRRMDSDTMKGPGSHEKVLEAFKLGQVEILLGTQMIAKGLDFPDVTLVGVVNADTALHLPDFRAAERTFQLVAQVAGRTGRGDRPGKVLVQTFNPDAAAIRFAVKHDYEGFVAEELPRRRDHGLPPYCRLVRLIARGREAKAVERYMEAIEREVRAALAPGMRILGPAPAPVAKIRELHRFHLQLRAPMAGSIQGLLRGVLPRVPAPGGVELAVDVDPVSLL
jgi:primosomal protein N' (replication factor Y)